MSSTAPSAWRIGTLTVLAMLAFAANSLLCRLALQQHAIDAASFGSLRLASGALVLAAIVHLRIRLRHRRADAQRPDWLAATMLWAYVVCFSFAYLWLAAGTGALVLFGAVQLTMFGAGLRAGERFAALAWAGFALAVAGLLVLLWPGLAAPAPAGAGLMAMAGVAWGVYSLRGRSGGEPVAATAHNFARATPLALAVSLLFAAQAQATAQGVLLAVVSGALTSGLGYVLWYAALPHLGSLRAATVQLSAPPLAALGGVLLLGEAATLRLAIASAAILGGIGLVLRARTRQAPRAH